MFIYLSLLSVTEITVCIVKTLISKGRFLIGNQFIAVFNCGSGRIKSKLSLFSSGELHMYSKSSRNKPLATYYFLSYTLISGRIKTSHHTNIHKFICSTVVFLLRVYKISLHSAFNRSIATARLPLYILYFDSWSPCRQLFTNILCSKRIELVLRTSPEENILADSVSIVQFSDCSENHAQTVRSSPTLILINPCL